MTSTPSCPWSRCTNANRNANTKTNANAIRWPPPLFGPWSRYTNTNRNANTNTEMPMPLDGFRFSLTCCPGSKYTNTNRNKNRNRNRNDYTNTNTNTEMPMTVGGLHPAILMFCCPMASKFWYQLNAPRCKLFQQPPWSCLLVAISFQIALVALVNFQMARSSDPV